MAPPPRKRRRAPTNPIEAANRKPDDQFIKDHLRPSPGWTSWTHPASGRPYALSLKSAAALAQHELQACFDLIERTSGADYRASRDGWKPLGKLKEMRSPELRYILVKEVPPPPAAAAAAAGGGSNDGDDGEKAAEEGRICGFTSLMPTFEEGEAVVYCYEIHLVEELRGTGMGRGLMDRLVRVAESISGVEKVMLTCFVANASARAFYERLGFERDAISPPERTLRSGRAFVPDYLIMSRRVRGERAQVQVQVQAGDGEEGGGEMGEKGAKGDEA
ncbi:acyl-CoA N-acyltransferase [Colletotrichum cereale]|nr:acyl-CoA N-acyltransferase [Colletotrichum cereale]